MDVLRLMPHGPAFVKYLGEVDGVWQLHKVIERGNIIHEMKSDNIVEQAFSVHLAQRQNPSAFTFLYEMFADTCCKVNEMKLRIESLPTTEFLVPVAVSMYKANMQFANTAGYEMSFSRAAINNLCGNVSRSVANTSRKVYYNVHFQHRTCDCKQSDVPCYHACSMLLQYMKGTLNCRFGYFYPFCHASTY